MCGGGGAEQLKKIPQMPKLNFIYQYRRKGGSCQGSNCVRTYEAMYIHVHLFMCIQFVCRPMHI
jgi:hypothetical protein